MPGRVSGLPDITLERAPAALKLLVDEQGASEAIEETPGMRVQWTRSSPSPPHSPLTRRPLGNHITVQHAGGVCLVLPEGRLGAIGVVGWEGTN